MWSHIGGTKLPPINWLITLHFFHINGMFFPLHCLTAGSTLTFVSESKSLAPEQKENGHPIY